jgi:hypothetical protein
LQQQQPTPPAPVSIEELAQLPCCSSILAATLRRLRRQAPSPPPGLLFFEGRLPEEDFPGLWAPLAREEEPAAGCRGSGTALGPSNGHRGSQLSLAEQCKRRQAALGAKVSGVAKRQSGGRGRGVVRGAAMAAARAGATQQEPG